MDDRYLTVLEYFKITEQLADHTAFSASRELALALRPSNDERDVRTMLQETTEAKDLLSKRPEIGIGGARDIRPLVRRAMLDAMLQPTELLEVRNTLSSARYLHNAIGRLTDECPLLADLAASLQPYPDIIEEIGRCLDDDGRVLDSASTALASIRRESNIARDRPHRAPASHRRLGRQRPLPARQHRHRAQRALCHPAQGRVQGAHPRHHP